MRFLEHEGFSRTNEIKSNTHVQLEYNTLFQLAYGARPYWVHPDEGKHYEMWSLCCLWHGGENFSLDSGELWHAKTIKATHIKDSTPEKHNYILTSNNKLYNFVPTLQDKLNLNKK